MGLTYFRAEVPVLLVFYALGVIDHEDIYALIRRTTRWADNDTMRRLLYPTRTEGDGDDPLRFQQHTIAVHSRREALEVLKELLLLHHSPTANAIKAGTLDPIIGTDELLQANVLPHLTPVHNKIHFLAHMVGILLNHLFQPEARRSTQYDKDRTRPRRRRVRNGPSRQQAHRRLRTVAGATAPQRAVPDARLRRIHRCPRVGRGHRRIRERGLAKGMTCRSQDGPIRGACVTRIGPRGMAQAVKSIHENSSRSMVTIQSAVVGYFESHTITKFIS